MLEQGLEALLLATPALTALVGVAGVYPVLVPENATYPALTYQVASASPAYALNFAIVGEKRIQFDAWGTNYADAKGVLQALQRLLDTFQGALSDGTVVLVATRVTETDFWEMAPRLYRAVCEYEIQFSESS